MPRGKYLRKQFTDEHKEKMRLAHLGIPRTEETKAKISKAMAGRVGIRGPEHGSWRGDDAQYSAVHSWLKRFYGKANKCEAKGCSGQSKTYQWALKKGKTYVHERNNYMMLCASCHQFYDAKARSKSGYLGIRKYENSKRWYAQIKVYRKTISLGGFDTLKEALEARAEAIKKYRAVIN